MAGAEKIAFGTNSIRESGDRRSDLLFIDGVIGCFSFGPDGKILWSNSRVSELLGYSRAELKKKSLFELCCDCKEGNERAERFLKKLNSGEKIQDEQLLLLDAEGSTIWISLNVAPRIETGQVLEYDATFTDISQQKKTEEVLKRNLDAQSAIHSILQLSLGELGVKEILDSTLQLLFMIPWLAVESKGSIFLMNPDESLTMISEYGMSDAIKTACNHIAPGYCLCGRAARDGEVIYSEHIDERHDILYNGIAPHGHYCIPMKSRGRVIGILTCYLEAGHQRDDTEIRFLSSVANVLAGVIERRRAEEKLYRSETHTRSLLRLSKGLEKTRDAREIVQVAYSEVKEILGYNSTWIGFGDVVSEKLHLLFQQGDVENFVELDTEFKVKGDAWLEEMVQAKGPMLCEDARTDPRTDKKRVAAEGYRTMLCVPIRLTDQSLAVMCTGTFGDEGVKVPSDEDIQYFSSMASSVAVVLDRISFIEQRERAQRALELSEKYTRSLLDVARAMESARSLEDIVEAAREEISKTIGYKTAWLCLTDVRREEARVLSIAGDMPEANYQLATIKVAGDKMMEEIMEGTHPVVVVDARTDPRSDKKMLEVTGNRTIINIPKILMDGSIGSLGTGTFLDEGVLAPTEQQVNYLSSMASSIAVVLDRFRFLEEGEKAQQEVVKEKNFTDVAVKNIPGIFFLNHQDRGMIKWNANLEKITGYSADEIAKMDLLDFFADEDRELVKRTIEKMYTNGFARVESKILTKDGRTVPFYITGSLVDMEDVKYVIGTCIDISKRKEAENALIKSEKKYRSLFEESQDVVYISKPEGRFLEMNPAGVKLFGFASEEELLNSDLDFYVNPKDRSIIRGMIERQGFISNYELDMKTRDGGQLIVSTTANAVHDDNGKIVAHRGIIRDITDLRKLEEQLVQAQKMESIGRLAGGLSHDLNNYLTAIQGYTDLAMMELPEDSPIADDLREARRSSDRATALTKQLLLFSRRESMEIRPVELNTVVSDLLKLLRQLVGEQFSLKTNLDEELHSINADAGYLEQVIMNLVVNARDAMPEGGVINIETRNVDVDQAYANMHPGSQPGQYVCLSVEDTGVGMDEAVMSRIFEPFFSTKKSDKGTGLGLSVVHGIVTQHGGWIDLKSTPGVGSSFMIYLPVVPAHAKEVVEEVKVSADFAGRGEKILLVEDDRNVRMLTKKLLDKFGFQVFTAPDAEEALRIFEEEGKDFHLVISDVVLPRQDGIQLVTHLREMKPEIKVLLMSGYSDELHRQAIHDRGYDFIRKPFTIPDLWQTIQGIIAPEDEKKAG